MAGEFSLRKIWTGFTQMPGKVLDYGSDVLKGTGTLLQSGSINKALSSATSGAMTAADTNKDGVVDGWEMLKVGFTGLPKLTLDTMANIGDPTRGMVLGDVKTGDGVKTNISMPSLDKMPVQAMPVSQPATVQQPARPTPPSTTISGIMGLGAGIAGTSFPSGQSAQAIYNAAPVMTKADINAINNSAMVANAISNPAARTVSHGSVASRFDPLAGHNAFVKKLDMAKFSGELNPTAAYADDQFNKQMQAELAGKAQ